MHAPFTTRPSKVSKAAPTRNLEYGVYENSFADCGSDRKLESRGTPDGLPSKQDFIRSSCCPTDNIQDLDVTAAILSLNAQRSRTGHWRACLVENHYSIQEDVLSVPRADLRD